MLPLRARVASITLTWLALLGAPPAVDAQLCELSGFEDAGAADVAVSYVVDLATSTLDYSIAADGIGSITSAQIFRAANLFLNLNGTVVAGVAFGTIQANGVDFADFVDDPQDYTTTITGTDGSVDVTVQLVDECLNENGVEPVDLRVLRVKAKNKLKATVRNLSATDSAVTVVRFFQSTDDTFDSGDLFFAEARLRSIPANKRRKAKTANRGGETGEFFVIGCADPQNFNNDPDPDNNCRATNNPVEFD